MFLQQLPSSAVVVWSELAVAGGGKKPDRWSGVPIGHGTNATELLEKRRGQKEWKEGARANNKSEDEREVW